MYIVVVPSPFIVVVSVFSPFSVIALFTHVIPSSFFSSVLKLIVESVVPVFVSVNCSFLV